MADVQTSVRTRTRRRLARAIAAVTAGAALIASVGLAIATAGAQTQDAEAAQAWNLVWSDEFNGSAGQLPSTANWQFDIGNSYPGGPANWGTGEIAYHTNNPANVSMDGSGNLKITALRDGSGAWTSARIETARADFKAPAGGTLRIEGRLQLPQVTGDAALGYWPAFWALGSPFRGNYWNWPGIGEFDVMENVNGQGTVHGVLHCGVAPGGPCNEFNGLGGTTQCGGSCHNGFHTYAFEWDDSGPSGQLRWYADGQLFHTVNESALPADTWAQMTDHAGYFILLNLAMGGAFPDGVAGHATPTAATQPGASLLVDYVRVYTAGGSGEPTGEPTTTPGGGGNRDAYAAIEATSFNGSSTGLPAAGGAIGPLGNGDWVRYDDVDFGSSSPLDFTARVASGAAGGVSGLVEVRIDSRTAAPIGTFAVANTGGWTSWRDVPGNVSAVTGVHDVYLTFTSGQPQDFVSVDQFHFRR
ncbi:glycoside hydrolase family 16 protein [Glycomyces albidus]|jgi:beta-glucanase (GH16 family)|uniref:Carbohydrate-binding protein n=1 Tax=Glycomyces albidus TaxID=2656774 RepID=A0A6L5G1X7_9ACTN|nr:glycoside hydrolase family 16 protein [Glycomyces albidus]MQM24166.1 carbohydrate-binding protein [Glycomyces albidus]